jgi:hypothetical protein
MLWVRIPPELIKRLQATGYRYEKKKAIKPIALFMNLSSVGWGLAHHPSSWSSLECSPPCQGGDRGFKSRWGR